MNKGNGKYVYFNGNGIFWNITNLFIGLPSYIVVFRGYEVIGPKSELEALKRGLFITWYAMTEPSCYTGIVILDSNAENRILKILDRRLKNEITDYELEWMIDYYSNWDFVFQRFTEFKYFQERLNRDEKVELPNELDWKEMSTRGQMGRYWNSLTKFK